MRLTTVKSSKEKITKGEVSVAHFIPYKCHWNSNTILTFNEELLRVIKIKGFAFETADDIDIDLKKNSRKLELRGYRGSNDNAVFEAEKRGMMA